MRTPPHPLRAIYQSIKTRCYNSKHPSYLRYGARGIAMCDRWRQSFSAFVEDMGPRPHAATVERRENSGNYEPGNCRWASRLEQGGNKRNNLIFVWNGEPRVLSHIAKAADVDYNSLRNLLMIRRGRYTLERAIALCRERGLKWRDRYAKA